MKRVIDYGVIYYAILDLLSYDGDYDDMYQILKDYKKSKSIYQALDKNKMYDNLTLYIDEHLMPSTRGIKMNVKKYDKQLSEELKFLLNEIC